MVHSVRSTRTRPQICVCSPSHQTYRIFRSDGDRGSQTGRCAWPPKGALVVSKLETLSDYLFTFVAKHRIAGMTAVIRVSGRSKYFTNPYFPNPYSLKKDNNFSIVSTCASYINIKIVNNPQWGTTVAKRQREIGTVYTVLALITLLLRVIVTNVCGFWHHITGMVKIA